MNSRAINVYHLECVTHVVILHWVEHGKYEPLYYLFNIFVNG